MVFIPTYLYIKQHIITGKLYFGKTTQSFNKMLKYKGSGKHWLSHIKLHNKEYVVTLWYQLYDNPFELVADALSMSKSFDIVDNDTWLNLRFENGLDGGSIGYKQSTEHTNKIRIANTGKKRTAETLLLLSISHIGIPQSEESKQKKRGKPSWNLGIPCTDKHKELMSIRFKGKSHTKEHNDKISLANSGENNSFYNQKHSDKSKNMMRIAKLGTKGNNTKYYDILTPYGFYLENILLVDICQMFNLNKSSLYQYLSKDKPYKGFRFYQTNATDLF